VEPPYQRRSQPLFVPGMNGNSSDGITLAWVNGRKGQENRNPDELRFLRFSVQALTAARSI
jgi:hypothetical protein